MQARHIRGHEGRLEFGEFALETFQIEHRVTRGAPNCDIRSTLTSSPGRQ